MSVCVLGSINLDIVCRVDALPARGETVAGLSVHRFPGGKGLNQAAASARWGTSTALIGAVGDDDAADPLLDELAAAGVQTSGVARLAGVATGHGYIFVSGAGENMIVISGGANRDLTTAHVRAQPAGDHTVFLSQLETPLAATAALFTSEAALRGVRILNAAPALDEGRALFPLADFIVVNEVELARYAGEEGEAATQARRLISRPGQTVVVTLGAAGAAAVDASDTFVAPGLAAQVVDTTGAGDCFCGVLAATLSQGADLRQALAWANAAAALSTQTAGAAPSMPTRAAVEAFVAAGR